MELTATPSGTMPWKLTRKNVLYALCHTKYGSLNSSEIDSTVQIISRVYFSSRKVVVKIIILTAKISRAMGISVACTSSENGYGDATGIKGV